MIKRIDTVKISWNKNSREHIKKHNVSEKEVEYALHDNNYKIRNSKVDGRYLLLVRSGTRLLSVVIKPKERSKNKILVITARDASKGEREIYRREK